MTSRIRKAATGLLGTVVILLCTGTTASAEPSTDPTVIDTAGYLGRQLEANDYALPGFAGKDFGLTIDAVFALTAAGWADTTVQRTVDTVQSDGWQYVQYSCYNDIGSFAKVALALQIGGGDPTRFDITNAQRFGNFDECGTAADPSTFPSHGPYPGADKSNTLDLIQLIRDELTLNPNGRIGKQSNHFDQTLAMLALARTPGGVPENAVTYTKGLQCLDAGDDNFGGLAYDDDNAATAPCDTIDGDSTGFLLSGLLAAGVPTDDVVVDRAVDWMQNHQDANGAFKPSFFGGAGNTNSTGLIANVARQVGSGASNDIADRAEAYLRELAVSCEDPISSADDPTQPGFARTWIGAIAYNQMAFESAGADGIQPNDEDQWRRATPQAVLGIGGLPGWSELDRTGARPDTPAPPCSPKAFGISATTRPVGVGTSTPLAASGLDPAEPYTITLSGEEIKTGTATAAGRVDTAIDIPSDLSTNRLRTLKVEGRNPDRSGKRILTTAAAATVKVSRSASTIKVARKLTVKLTGLLPGENAQVVMSGNGIKNGYATSSGTYTTSFTVRASTGTKSIRGYGVIKTRTGTASVKVVK